LPSQAPSNGAALCKSAFIPVQKNHWRLELRVIVFIIWFFVFSFPPLMTSFHAAVIASPLFPSSSAVYAQRDKNNVVVTEASAGASAEHFLRFSLAAKWQQVRLPVS
jgi:hypothetical protein